MVTTEVAQLSKECNAWRETLRSFKDEFSRFKNRLQELAGRQTHRDVLLEVEHLDNQFHIQLINIHDLKQSIKIHQRQVEAEMAATGSVSDELLAHHENLYDNYQQLDHTLHELRSEFDHFSAVIR
jgi:chromosome segregation ATPase